MSKPKVYEARIITTVRNADGDVVSERSITATVVLTRRKRKL